MAYRIPDRENSRARRSGNLICTGKRTSLIRTYIRVHIILLAPIPSVPWPGVWLMSRQLSLRHKPPPASASACTLAGSSAVCYSASLEYSSTTTWHSTPSDLWIPSYRVSPLSSRETSSSLGARTRRGINLAARGSTASTSVPEMRRRAAPERSVSTYLLNRCMRNVRFTPFSMTLR